MRTFLNLLLVAVFAASLGCGGGSSVTASPSPLAYQDPDPTGWRLVMDDSTTSERLVLALVGPTGVATRGASITLLTDDTLAAFTPFDDGAFIQSTGVYVLASTDRTSEATKLQPIAGSAFGNKLTVGLFQKSAAEPAKESGRPLFRVALKAKPGIASGTTIPILLRKATYLPDDLTGLRLPPTMSVAIGRLSVQ